MLDPFLQPWSILQLLNLQFEQFYKSENQVSNPECWKDINYQHRPGTEKTENPFPNSPIFLLFPSQNVSIFATTTHRFVYFPATRCCKNKLYKHFIWARKIPWISYDLRSQQLENVWNETFNKTKEQNKTTIYMRDVCWWCFSCYFDLNFIFHKSSLPKFVINSVLCELFV